MKMGAFKVKIKVADIGDSKFNNAIEVDSWVDSGATMTLIPSHLLRQLNVTPTREKSFKLADGRVIKRQIGIVHIEIDGDITTNEVVFGDDGADALLGAITLESTGLLIDLENQRLLPRPGGIIQYSILS